MKGKHLFIIIFFIGYSFAFGQARESDRLLQQSFETVHTHPNEAVQIARYLIKTASSPEQKAKAYLLSAKAHYTKGAYDQSLSDAFEARNLSFKKDQSYSESTLIIADILDFMQLNAESEKYSLEIKLENQTTAPQNLGEIEALMSRSESHFQRKQNDSAVLFLEKALILAQKINNPFLQLKLHEKLSTNFLALDQNMKYQTHNQKVLALRSLTTQIENNTFNTAHQLITREKEEELAATEKQYARLFRIFLIMAGFCLLVQITLKLRNRNKLKTYATLLKYLNKEKEKAPEPQKEIQPEAQRGTTILKESEDQILTGLQKFESSKRFISKDMSLGMLAAQLNTNTKYLSEVINRHKEKNFNSYINELRINYITEKIKTQPNYRNYKVSYLAEECGFASHSTFTTVFKSVVGVSPITFVEFVRKEMSKEKVADEVSA